MSSRIDVVGWVLSPDSARLEVLARHGSTVVGRAHNDDFRPDVAARFPEIVGAQRCGFAIDVDAAALAPGLQTIVIDALHPSGATRTVTERTVIIDESQAPTVRRGDYRLVWDRVSTSERDARNSVCGDASDEEWIRSGERTAAAILSRTGIGPNDTILEIGCGAGRIGAHLAPKAARWIGADVSANMLELCRQQLAGVPGVELIRLEGSDLRAIADATIDVAYCSAVFMHLDEWDRYRYVQEMARVLRPGGRVYYDNFTIEGPDGWRFFEEATRYDPLSRPPNISRPSTGAELRTYAERAGFSAVDVLIGTMWATVVARRPAAAE